MNTSLTAGWFRRLFSLLSHCYETASNTIVLVISGGSVSVFSVGFGVRFFVGLFLKSVQFSVSVFQNIAISVRLSVFFSVRSVKCNLKSTLPITV